MRSPLAALAVLAVFAAVAGRAAQQEEYVYVGASAPGGPALAGTAPEQLGIYVLTLDPKTGQLSTPALSLQLQRATAFAIHPTLPILYSVANGSGPQSNSELYSLRSDPATGQLIVINHVDSGGHDATALALDAASQTLFAAHYGSGTLSAVSVNANGTLGAVTSSQTDMGSGPSPRQKSAHAHDVVLAPGGKYALVTDLGADRIFVYPFDASSRTLAPGESTSVPAGAGPRHLVFSRDGRFVLVNTELTAELRSYHWDPKAGRLSAVQDIPAYPAGKNGEKSTSELALSKAEIERQLGAAVTSFSYPFAFPQADTRFCARFRAALLRATSDHLAAAVIVGPLSRPKPIPPSGRAAHNSANSRWYCRPIHIRSICRTVIVCHLLYGCCYTK